jgi:hypothetical protein
MQKPEFGLGIEQLDLQFGVSPKEPGASCRTHPMQSPANLEWGDLGIQYICDKGKITPFTYK